MRIQTRDRDKVVLDVVAPFKRNGMVAFPFSLFFLITILFCSPSTATQPHSSLAVNTNFDTDIDLFGDAHPVADGVTLTRPSAPSSGLLLRTTPVTFSGGASSLSAEFTFSISPSPSAAAGDGLVLVLVDFSAAFPGSDSFGLSQQHSKNYVAVEFDTSKDDNVNDPNGNHVCVDVGSLVSVAIANVSDSNIVLNSGEKLTAWVDYVAGSKRLEARLGKFGEKRPANPVVSHEIDLVKVWGGERVFVGLSSSNGGDSVQVVRVYSWKVSLGKVEKSLLHSEPADPRKGYPDGHVAVVEESSSERGVGGTLSVLAGVIFGTGCVALVSFVGLFMWAIFFQGREEELSLGKIPDNLSEIRYERIDVAVDKNTEEGEN